MRGLGRTVCLLSGAMRSLCLLLLLLLRGPVRSVGFLLWDAGVVHGIVLPDYPSALPVDLLRLADNRLLHLDTGQCLGADPTVPCTERDRRGSAVALVACTSAPAWTVRVLEPDSPSSEPLMELSADAALAVSPAPAPAEPPALPQPQPPPVPRPPPFLDPGSQSSASPRSGPVLVGRLSRWWGRLRHGPAQARARRALTALCPGGYNASGAPPECAATCGCLADARRVPQCDFCCAPAPAEGGACLREATLGCPVGFANCSAVCPGTEAACCQLLPNGRCTTAPAAPQAVRLTEDLPPWVVPGGKYRVAWASEGLHGPVALSLRCHAGAAPDGASPAAALSPARASTAPAFTPRGAPNPTAGPPFDVAPTPVQAPSPSAWPPEAGGAVEAVRLGRRLLGGTVPEVDAPSGPGDAGWDAERVWSVHSDPRPTANASVAVPDDVPVGAGCHLHLQAARYAARSFEAEGAQTVRVLPPQSPLCLAREADGTSSIPLRVRVSAIGGAYGAAVVAPLGWADADAVARGLGVGPVAAVRQVTDVHLRQCNGTVACLAGRLGCGWEEAYFQSTVSDEGYETLMRWLCAKYPAGVEACRRALGDQYQADDVPYVSPLDAKRVHMQVQTDWRCTGCGGPGSDDASSALLGGAHGHCFKIYGPSAVQYREVDA